MYIEGIVIAFSVPLLSSYLCIGFRNELMFLFYVH